MAKYFFFERPQIKKCRLHFRNINVILKKGEIKNKNQKKKKKITRLKISIGQSPCHV